MRQESLFVNCKDATQILIGKTSNDQDLENLQSVHSDLKPLKCHLHPRSEDGANYQ